LDTVSDLAVRFDDTVVVVVVAVITTEVDLTMSVARLFDSLIDMVWTTTPAVVVPDLEFDRTDVVVVLLRLLPLAYVERWTTSKQNRLQFAVLTKAVAERVLLQWPPLSSVLFVVGSIARQAAIMSQYQSLVRR
jgi:hypothetical protein